MSVIEISCLLILGLLPLAGLQADRYKISPFSTVGILGIVIWAITSIIYLWEVTK